MNLDQRLSAFAKLGPLLPGLGTGAAARLAHERNPWFTGSELKRALAAWSDLLSPAHLSDWSGRYPIPSGNSPANIRVITAGNIPLVGFHDFLCTLVTGNRFIGSLSSRDAVLLPAIAEILAGIEPHFKELVSFSNQPIQPDAVIATGSNNSARYFASSYGHLPHIIRRNRISVAILDGSESDNDLHGLSDDILSYYGLGCRNISIILAYKDFHPDNLARILRNRHDIDECPLLYDNLRYQRALLTMKGAPFTDAGNVLLCEQTGLGAPVGVVHVQYQSAPDEAVAFLHTYQNEIQCVAGNRQIGPAAVPFGKTQYPALGDYADGVDTVEFLLNL